MNYRRLGRAGVKLSELSFGAWVTFGDQVGEDVAYNCMVAAYEALHQVGFAHSIETWVHGRLVGGLYCVAIGHAVFGESMFSRETDASKIALAGLVAFCRVHQMPLIDCQQNTRHLHSFGAGEIARESFMAQVKYLANLSAHHWKAGPMEPLYWQKILGAAESA